MTTSSVGLGGAVACLRLAKHVIARPKPTELKHVTAGALAKPVPVCAHHAPYLRSPARPAVAAVAASDMARELRQCKRLAGQVRGPHVSAPADAKHTPL